MPTAFGFPCGDDYVSTLITVKARQLARRADLRDVEVEDLQQDMRLHLLQRLARFDPKRSSLNTFCARVLDHWIASFLRSRNCRKRSGDRHRVSLEGGRSAGTRTHVPFSEMVYASSEPGHGGDPLDEAMHHERASHVRHQVAALPPALAEVATALMTDSEEAVRRQLGLSRKQMGEALHQLRNQLRITDL